MIAPSNQSRTNEQGVKKGGFQGPNIAYSVKPHLVKRFDLIRPDANPVRITFLYDGTDISVQFATLRTREGDEVFDDMIVSLRKMVPGAAYDVGAKCWKSRNTRELSEWVISLVFHNFPAHETVRASKFLEEITSAPDTSGITVFSQDVAIGPIVPEKLLRLEGLDRLYPGDVDALLKHVPGIFFMSQTGMPLSAASVRGKSNTRTLPRVGYCSLAYHNQIGRLFPASESVLSLARNRAGLTTPPLMPQDFPVAGINPDTGNPYALYSYQVGAASRLTAIKAAILPLPTGAGKTIVATAAAERLLATGEADRVIVIATKSAQISVWRNLLREYYGRDALVVDGTKQKRLLTYARYGMAGASPYLITRYDQWLKARSHKDLGKVAGEDLPWLKRFMSPKTVVIIDECHKLKHHTIGRYQGIANALLEGHVSYRWLLTGTIVHDKVQDIYGPIRLLGWKVWNNYNEFRDTYFENERVMTSGGFYVTKSGALSKPQAKELYDVLGSVSYLKTLDELEQEMPERIPLTRVANPTSMEDRAYAVIKGEILSLLDKAERADADLQDVKTRAKAETTTSTTQTKATQAALVEAEQKLKDLHSNLLATISMERLFSADPALVLTSPSDSALALCDTIGRLNLLTMSPGSKVRELLNWLEDFLEETDAKVIIFSSFKKMVDQFKAYIDNPPSTLDREQRDVLEYLRGRSVFFTGGMTPREIESVTSRFKNDPGVRVLFSSDAGGESQNFQTASYVVHYDLPFTMGAVEQREGRVRRLGQKAKNIFVLDLRFSLQEQTKEELASRASRYVDARLRGLIDHKTSQKERLLGPTTTDSAGKAQ